MGNDQEKDGGFQQVGNPKAEKPESAEKPAKQRRRRELAKTVEGPPPSAALKPNKRGVDPLGKTGVFQSDPPPDGKQDADATAPTEEQSGTPQKDE